MVDRATISQYLCLRESPPITPEKRGDEYGIARTETDFVTAYKRDRTFTFNGPTDQDFFQAECGMGIHSLCIISHLYDHQDKVMTKILLRRPEFPVECVRGNT